MNTTTYFSNIMLDEDNMLIRNDGTYNQDIHSKLSRIISNIANKYARTNETIAVEDLKQEAWVKVLEAIEKGKNKGESREIKYLIMVAKNAILAQCMNVSHRREYEDDYSSFLMSSMDSVESDSRIQLNVAKSKLEYEISRNKPREDESISLKIGLEQVLENLKDERVKTLIIIKYVKEFDGKSQRIIRMYNDFRNSIDDERREVLDKMTKFTNNAAFKAMGIRATDNCTTRIRASMKDILSILR